MDFMNLANVKTRKLIYFGGGLLVDAECSLHLGDCPKCYRKDALRKHGSKLVRYLDTPFDGRPVRIQMRVQRYRCRGCLATTLQYLPEVDNERRITKRGIRYICEQQWFHSYGRLARSLGCADKAIRNVEADFPDSPCPVGTSEDRPFWTTPERLRKLEHRPKRRFDLIQQYGLPKLPPRSKRNLLYRVIVVVEYCGFVCRPGT
jgi:hypothetical protein